MSDALFPDRDDPAAEEMLDMVEREVGQALEEFRHKMRAQRAEKKLKELIEECKDTSESPSK